MCIFVSFQNRVDVSDTNIYVKVGKHNLKNFIAYQMKANAAADGTPLAMVLPVPSQTVELVDMEKNTEFFAELQDYIMPSRAAKGLERGGMQSMGLLEVQQVGNYKASIVPGLSEFDRLHPMFNLPTGDLRTILAEYDEAGFQFVIAMLDPGELAHPMGIYYKPQNDYELYVPTKHFYGKADASGTGEVSRTALEEFDHTLYISHPSSLDYGLTAPGFMKPVDLLGKNAYPTTMKVGRGGDNVFSHGNHRFDLELESVLHRISLKDRFENTDIIRQPKRADEIESADRGESLQAVR